jgi:hypothetical protein
MDALMRMMRQTHHGAMNTSMFDAEPYSIKQSPCRLDEKSDGRTTPQYEYLCDSRANIMRRRRREEVLDMPQWGKCAKSRIYIYRRYAHNLRASYSRPQCLKEKSVTFKRFETCTVARAFSMRVERTYSWVQTPIN